MKPLSTQIDSPLVGGELKVLAGDGLFGLPSRDGGFSTVLQGLSRQNDIGREAKADDGSPTTTTAAAATPSKETSSGTDAEALAAQAETGTSPATTTSSSDPLLLALLGAAMVQQAPPVASTQKAAGTDATTKQIEVLSDSQGTSAIQPTVQPAEGIVSPLGQEAGLKDLPAPKAATATGDIATALSSPRVEGQPLSPGAEGGTPVTTNSDLNQPLTVGQGQEAQSRDPQQGLPIMAQPEKDVPQTLAPLPQTSMQPTATATAQLANQNGEAAAAQPDRSQGQQVLGKAEPSLHQRNMQTESPTAQTAAVVSAQTQGEGQGFQNATDGQKKDEGLKWLSRVDLQSAEVSPRQSQQPGVEAHDSGLQYQSAPPGQGGTPANSRSAPASVAPPASLTSRLSPEPETAPVPGSHSVQFDLAPSDFGQLRVRVVLSDQTIHTHMSTDRAELGQMLTNQQEQLSAQLSSAGLDLGRFQVQVDQGSTGQSGQEWQSQAQGGRSQEQRESRQQDLQEDAPVPAKASRSGALSLFA
ncbi:MAG: flagellar hook-length control protein FliK [Nitrospirae bacterium]|nr:flagellar hook-length control protein FliK [Nitrospirota bacterium]